MRKFLFIFFLLTGTAAPAQPDSVKLKTAMQQLDQALIQQDEKLLQKVMHPDISFGHSTGWVQSWRDVLHDFRTGKLIYEKLEHSAVWIATLNKNLASVRMNTHATGKLNGNPFDLNMHVLQVWMKTKKGWQLWARQSAKLQAP
jgi:hypothetical protein